MLVFGWLGAAAGLLAQQPPVHYLHQGVMPPGAIGRQQLQRGGPLCGFYQPVEIKAPPGALVSLAVANRFDDAQPAPRQAGFLIGEVYRLRVTNLAIAEGAEVFPSIEVIDRLYAPVDQQRRFAIPVELTADDLQLALDGKFVTRVIYLEDPHNALPARRTCSRNIGSRRRRDRIHWPLPTRSAVRWPSCDSADDCPNRSTHPIPASFSIRRRFSPLHPSPAWLRA